MITPCAVEVPAVWISPEFNNNIASSRSGWPAKWRFWKARWIPLLSGVLAWLRSYGDPLFLVYFSFNPLRHGGFAMILHAILHTRSHHLSLRAALRDIPKTNLRALGL